MDFFFESRPLVKSLYTEEHWVVHQALTPQELNILANWRTQDAIIYRCLFREASMLSSCHDKVYIFERCRWLGLTFDFPVDFAAFQVEYVVQSVRIFQAKSVFHEHDVNSIRSCHFHRKDAKYFRK